MFCFDVTFKYGLYMLVVHKSFSLFLVHKTYGFMSHTNDKAIMVKYLAQGQKFQDWDLI